MCRKQTLGLFFSMIKKLVIVFLFTGSAYLLSVFVLKWMAQAARPEQVAAIGEFESLLQLVIGLVGFGMQSAAIRNIALNDNWQEKLNEAQTARLTFGIFLAGAAILAFLKNSYWGFVLAPLVAASADYALYARGLAIAGAGVAFVRVALPLLAGLLAVFFCPRWLYEVYIAATLAAYFITNSLISFFLKSKIFFKPSLSSLRLYLTTLPLGILNLTFYFMGLGILLIAPLFFDDQGLVISFLALKFYAIYKGVIRVIQQAFVNQMLSEKVCLNVDRLGMMISLALLGSVLVFPHTFIALFFGSQYAGYSAYFLWLALAAVSFSIFNSFSTRLILEHKEILFMKISVASLCVTVIGLVAFSHSDFSTESIPLSLFLGETAMAVSFVFWFLDAPAIGKRITFFLLSSISLIIPFSIGYFWGETPYTYFISFVLMGIVLLLFTYKNFSLPEETIPANPHSNL